MISVQTVTLEGHGVRLEPLEQHHEQELAHLMQRLARHGTLAAAEARR